MHQLQPPVSFPSPPLALTPPPPASTHPAGGGGCGALPGSFGLLANERGRLLVALWVCALVERASSSPGKSRPERPDHSSSPPPSADSLPLGGGRRPGALSRIGFCTYRETKGVSRLELAKEDQSPFPSPRLHPRSGNWPECFRGLNGCLILRGSGQSWGRQRITLGPDKSQAAPY